MTMKAGWIQTTAIIQQEAIGDIRLIIDDAPNL